MTTAPVSAVVVTMKPRSDHYTMTLRSLAQQKSPPSEVILVDSTPGGHAAGESNDCSLCEKALQESIEELREKGATVKKEHVPDSGIGEARRIGLNIADEAAVWHLDEDAVIVTPDWTERALTRLDNPDVAAVGGNVAPLRENTEGRLFGSVDAATQSVPGGWYIMYPRKYCREDGKCLMFGQGRGEDITARQQLSEEGAVVRDPELLAKKDLPTDRQQKARNVVLSAAGGAVAGAVTDKLVGSIVNRVL
jgi:hypothetical protein